MTREGLDGCLRDLFAFVPFGLAQTPHIVSNAIRQFIGSHRSRYDSLEDVVDHALRETGAQKVHLVGYSLGGLYARAYAQARPESVSGCFTWVTPHLGTPLATVGAFSRMFGLDEGVIGQMACGSPYLARLHKEFQERRVEYVRKNVHFVNFLARRDLLVPYPYSVLPFADRQYECRRSLHINAVLSSYLGRAFMQELAFLPSCPIVMLHGMWATPEMFSPLIRRVVRTRPELAGMLFHVHYDARKEIPDYRARYALAS